MKNNLRLFVFIFFFCLFLPRLNAEQESLFLGSETTISMDFQDANLKDILKIFSIQSGLNFIASEAVQDRKITLYLDKVPIKESMDKLFQANNLTYELDEEANIFIVKDWGKPQIETITEVFYLKYATVSSSPLKEEMSKQIGCAGTQGGGGVGTAGTTGGGTQDAGITKAVEKILSEHGSVIEDYRTNSLIVTDIPSRMPIINQTIASLDVPVPQVMLEVEMLDVSKSTVDKLGFQFGENPFTLILPGGFVHKGADFFIRGLNATGTATIEKNASGSLTLGSTYAGLLDFLRTNTDTKTLARPRLLTLNNESAEIKITTKEVIGEVVTYNLDTGQPQTRTAERTETGVSLRVTPQVNLETGEITMFLYPSVKEATTSAFSAGYRDPEERGTKSLVKVKDGETVIVGGLIRNEFYQSITKLPILGDIPFVGALFRHKNKDKDRQRELLVFITPHIIRDTNAQFPAMKGATLGAKEQGKDAAFDRQLAVNTSLNSFEKIWK